MVDDAAEDERFRENPVVVGDPHIRFYAGVPLVAPGGYALGTICVIDRKPRQLRPDQLNALEALSRQVIAQLELARQRRQLEQLLEEHKRAIFALEALNKTLQNSVEGIAKLDGAGHFVSVNSRYAAAAGYRPEQMVGMPWQATVHPEDQERVQEAISTLSSTGRTEVETRGLQAKGGVFYKQLTLVPLYDTDQKYDGFYCFLRDTTESKMLEKRLMRGAYHDALTDLPNRASFLESLEVAIGRAARRKDYSFAVLYIDLDGFKEVNDTYGHAAGDGVLVEASLRLQNCIRPGDIAARLGGDEFAVMLDDILYVEDASEVAGRIVSALAASIFWEEHQLLISASVGLASSADSKTLDAEQIVSQADMAMYRAKQAGKNQVCIFDSALVAADETQLYDAEDFVHN